MESPYAPVHCNVLVFGSNQIDKRQYIYIHTQQLYFSAHLDSVGGRLEGQLQTVEHIRSTVMLRFRKSISGHNFQTIRKLGNTDFQYHRVVIYSI